MEILKSHYVVTFFRNDPDGAERVVSRHGISEPMLRAYVAGPAVALTAARRTQRGLKATGFRVVTREGVVVLHFRSPEVP